MRAMIEEQTHLWGATNGRWMAAALALAFCLSTVLIAPVEVFAQEGGAEDEKEETEIKVFKRQKKEERKKVEKSGPKYKSKTALREFKLVAQQKRDEVIRGLKDLIEDTEEDDPEKPELLFQLSEMLWQKSKYFEQQAFKTQDDMYQARDRKDTAAADRLKQRMKDYMSESTRQREEAVELYVAIIRDHKQYDKLADVYFYLGANLLEIGKRPQALRVFKQLKQRFPNSPYLPNALLAEGEYYFDNNDMKAAATAYRDVLRFKSSNIHTYAMYKLAWCEYNESRYKEAMQLFVDVVKETERRKRDQSLRKEALRDIVLTYSHFGSASQAIKFFQKLVKDKGDVLYMGEKLAILLADEGKVDGSTKLFKKLIELNAQSFKIVGYQLEIVRNVETLGNKIETVKEVRRAIKILGARKSAKDAEAQEIKIAEEKLELIIREYATTYHREAQKTRNDETYALAYNLYKDYLDYYPNSKDVYAMTFFYAEMLYRLEKFDEAAARYEKVLELKPQGEYNKEAVHAAVLSYQKLVQVSEQREAPDKKDLKTKPKKLPIPDAKQRLIKACDRYIKVAPDAKSAVKVQYTAARTFYDYNHFDDAILRFNAIIKKHPTHRLAVIAADLHLDSLNLMQDYEGLADAVQAYLANNAIAQGEFLVRLEGIAEQTAFNKCTGIEGRKEWETAAKCFTDFCNQFPESEQLDKALYNAALDYERIRQIGRAIRIRKHLLKHRSDSSLVPETLFNMAGNYHALAVYSEASKYYEMFFNFFPKHEKAELALRNAATFRQGLGDYKAAIANYEKYLELFPAKKEAGAEVFFQIGVIYEQEGRKKDAFQVFDSYIKRWGKVGKMDRLLESHVKIGQIHWKADRTKKAMASFEQALKIYAGLRENQIADLVTGGDAAAEARFMQGEAKLREMERIKLKLPEKELKKRLNEKIKVLGEVQEIYQSVIKYARPGWAIAALYRLGYVAQTFADEIRNSPVPKGLTYDQTEIYKGGLEEQATQIDQAAIGAYEDCLAVALNQSWFNEFSTKAEIALAGLKPRVYRKPSELRAQPYNAPSGYVGAKFSSEALAGEEDTTMSMEQGGTN